MESKKSRESSVKTPSQGFVVWLKDEDKIASFHPVEGFRRQSFQTHQFFLDFLCELQASGFRFQ